MLSRPATLPLIPATSWEKRRLRRSPLNRDPPSHPSHPVLAHLDGGGGAFRGADDVPLLPHALDVARASRGDICHCRLGGFHFFVSLWKYRISGPPHVENVRRGTFRSKDGTVSDRSPGWLRRTGPFCCRSWRRWGRGTLSVWCCVDEHMRHSSSDAPVYLSTLISHLFCADLLKNSAFSPIWTEKKKGFRLRNSLSVTCQITTSIQDDLTRPARPRGRLPVLGHPAGCRVSVWLSASQQIHKQPKMNCTSCAGAGGKVLDLVPEIVRQDIYGVTPVFDEGRI